MANVVTLKEVFDRQFNEVKFDEALCKRIIQYSVRFMNRNEDHSAFFGGVLLGVNPVKFFDADREAWFEEVLDVDEGLIENDFLNVTTVNHEFNVMGDLFNYTPSYIMHRLLQNNKIPNSIRHEAMVHAYMVMHFRFITSLLVKRFKYPADPEVATATYLALNGRFDIRKYGSWRELIRARAEDLVSSKSIYFRTVQAYSPDNMLIRNVTDTQSRIRSLIKKIYAIHKNFSDRGIKVKATSDTTVNTEGETILKDRKNGYGNYLKYADETIPNPRNFIREELLDVVASALQTMPKQLLKESLEYLSRNYFAPGQKYLGDIVKEILLYSFEHLYVTKSMNGERNDLASNISKLLALLRASRSNDPIVLKLREDTEKMVRLAVKSKNNTIIPAIRTGVLIYIVLRVMTKEHYSK